MEFRLNYFNNSSILKTIINKFAYQGTELFLIKGKGISYVMCLSSDRRYLFYVCLSRLRRPWDKSFFKIHFYPGGEVVFPNARWEAGEGHSECLHPWRGWRINPPFNWDIQGQGCWRKGNYSKSNVLKNDRIITSSNFITQTSTKSYSDFHFIIKRQYMQW